MEGRVLNMKRIALAVLLLALCAFGAQAAQADSRPAQTVLFYMVGADLESARALASSDLEEIAQAVSTNPSLQAVAYAGGANRWQCELLGSAQNGVLALKGGAWKLVDARPPENMCVPETLSAFLTDAVRLFPAESYALVLWNHGSGPLLGYGVDERFGGDMLTLAELRSALKNSPFASGQPLDWIGFDACLMGSIETAHAVRPFARYLIASQEVEPGEGWDYRFLADIEDGEDGASIGPRIVQSYMDSYLRMYADFPAYTPPLTLSCLDLAQLDGAEDALERLSARMTGTLEAEYSRLVHARLDTNGFGRFSAGAELDLVDLDQLAQGLESSFPEEAGGLRAALERLTLVSDANVPGAGGLSIYFPFYNKASYVDSWGQLYAEMEFCPSYTRFLRDYARVWLGAQRTKWSGTDAPVLEYADSAHAFTLMLTPAQRENFASAHYEVLRRTVGEQYEFIYSSADVTLEDDGLLRANYDGRALWCLNKKTGALGGAVRFREYDRTEKNVRYLVRALLRQYAHGELFDIDNTAIGAYLQVECDLISGEATILGMIPDAGDSAVLGKRQIQMNEIDRISFASTNRYKPAEADGILPAFDQWPLSGTGRGYSFDIDRNDPDSGVALRLMPAAEGLDELYLMLVVTDLQGNQTGSDLLPVNKVEAAPSPEPALPPATVFSVQEVSFPRDSAAEKTLIDLEQLKVSALGFAPYVFYDARLRLRIENRADELLKVNVSDVSVNGLMLAASLEEEDSRATSSGGLPLKSGEAKDFALLIGIGNLRALRQTAIEDMEFTVTLTRPDEYNPLLTSNPVRIKTDFDLGAEVGALPPEDAGLAVQERFDIHGLGLSVVSARADAQSNCLRVRVLIENNTGYPVKPGVSHTSADDYMVESRLSMDNWGPIPSGKRAYGSLDIDQEHLARCGIDTPQKVECTISASLPDFGPKLFEGDIRLTFTDPASGNSIPGNYPVLNVLDHDGITMTLERIPPIDGNAATFRATVVNGSKLDIEIGIDTVCLNGNNTRALLFYPNQVLAGKRGIFDISLGQDALRDIGASEVTSLSTRFVLLDAKRQAVVRTSDEFELIG